MFARAIVVAGLAALAAAQSASLGFTRVPNPVTVGQAESITYRTNDESSPVTILLRKGESNNLQTVATLTENATGGEYKWTPSSDLASGSDYALQIKQGDQVNYYGPFTINGGSASASGYPSSSSSSHMMSASGYPSSSSHMMTMSASRNATLSMTTAASVGTGMSMSRNVTMSKPTLTGSSSASASSEASQTTNAGAGFQGSTTGSAVASSTGGASMMTTGGSVVALVFGAVAAAVFA